MESRTRWPPTLIAAGFMITAILVITLRPLPGASQQWSGLCVLCGDLGGVDFLANVLLFVPLGFVLVMAPTRPLAATLACLALTLLIEGLQWTVVPGRNSSLGDLLANTIGGGIGAWLGIHWRSLVEPSPRRAARLVVTWGALAAAFLTLAWWMVLPAPVEYRMRAYRSPEVAGYGHFRGSVRSVQLFGRELGDSVLVDPIRLPRPYALGDLDLGLALVASPSNASEMVFRLGSRFEEQVHIVRTGDDLIVSPRLNGSRLKLWSPSIKLADALRTDGTAFSIRILRSRHELQLRGADTARTFRFKPSDAWRFFFRDERVPAGLQPALGLLTFALLGTPMGYWSAGVARPGVGLVTLGAAAAVGLVGVPVLLGLPLSFTVLLPGLVIPWVFGLVVGRFRLRSTKSGKTAP